MCTISVVTSVYNCEKYIAETIQSVLNQTFQDFEFIIINDCSKDKSADIIRKFQDDRIRFIDNQINKGQAESLNYGISIAKGKYIARLDHDDICYPQRFEKQVKYMESHPEVVLVGCWWDNLINGEYKEVKRPDIHGKEEFRFSLPFINYIPHSSFMIRRDAMLNNNIKYGKYLYAEDYQLLLDMLKVGEIDSLEDILIAYRIFPEQFTQTCSNDLIEFENKKIRKLYNWAMNPKFLEAVEKSAEKKLCSKRDCKLFEVAFTEYAESCKIEKGKRQDFLNLIYKNVMLEQKGNLTILISYLTSQYFDLKWFFSIEGLYFIKKCVLHQ